MIRRRWSALRITAAVVAGLAGLLLPTPAAASDTSVEHPVSPGQRIEVRSYRGSIRIEGWDRDAIQVEADHSRTDEILVERHGATWRVTPASWERDSRAFALRLPEMARVQVTGTPPAPADLQVRVPAWMAVAVETPNAPVTVHGLTGPLDVTTVMGPIAVDGGGTPLRLRSMLGRIDLRGSRGRASVEGAGASVRVRDSAGELRVETTSGSIRLANLETTDVDVTTVDGDIELSGPLSPGGQYQLITHSGDVDLSLTGTVDAQFSVRAFEGDFTTDLPEGKAPGGGREFTVGEGSARIRLESFSGRIAIRSSSP